MFLDPPPNFTSSLPKVFLIFPLHKIPQVQILDYVTIQKQGPLFTTTAHQVAIVYVHWYVKTAKAESDGMRVMSMCTLGDLRETK